MASSKCSIDPCKRPGDNFCEHCQSQVCTKHYIEHVKKANEELHVFTDELNSLMVTLQKQRPEGDALKKLDEWRKENHRRIEQAYEERRKRLQDGIDHKVQVQIEEIRGVNQRLQELIEEGDASFQQINEMRRSIEQCRRRCDRLHLEESDEPSLDLISNVPLSPLIHRDGRLLSMEHRRQLNEWIGSEVLQWKLIYQASRDGFKSENFHQHCDGVGATVTVIETVGRNYLFGGYTPVVWHRLQCYTSDRNDSFLFTLTNPHSIPPTKYPIRYSNYAIYGHSNYGPTFGAGHDIYVSNESNQNANNTFNFPHTYIDTTGRGAVTFTGNKQFQTNEIEVYRVMPLN